VKGDPLRINPWLHDGLSSVYEKQGRFEEAFRECSQFVEIRPGLPYGHDRLLSLFWRLEKPEAVADTLDGLAVFLERYRDHAQEGPQTRQTLALAKLHGVKGKDPATALALMEQVAATGGPSSPFAASVLAEASFACGKRREAIVVLEGALEGDRPMRFLKNQLDSYRKLMHFDLASYASVDAALDSLSSADSDQQVLDDFRTVASGEDASHRLSYLEARLLERHGQREQAIEKLRELIGRDRKRAEPVLRLASILRAAGDPSSAEQALLEALQDGLDTTAVWDLWAVVAFSDLGRSASDLLSDFPCSKARARGSDLHWLFDRLTAGDPVRIRCGGDEYHGSGGAVWDQDRFFRGGEATTKYQGEIVGTEDDVLYRTQRLYKSDIVPPEGYCLPLPKGAYRVTLHFAETWFHTQGQRVFDVRLEGKTVLQGYEPLAAGFATAEAKSFEVEVTDGLLEIEFVHRMGEPTVSGIEVNSVK
jgi:tetratricopeptide (TPR) repeat protein